MAEEEKTLLNRFMLYHSEKGGRFFRCNTGSGWVGKTIGPIRGGMKTIKIYAGDLVIRQARRFSTGWPKGTSDLIGFTPIVITTKMVGKTIAVFTGIEVKTGKLKATTEQTNFINMVNNNGGIAIVAREQDDVINKINKYKGE